MEATGLPPICEAVGCVQTRGLQWVFRGRFCRVHKAAIGSIRTMIKQPGISIHDEIFWRMAEARSRKFLDAAHVQRIVDLQTWGILTPWHLPMSVTACVNRGMFCVVLYTEHDAGIIGVPVRQAFIVPTPRALDFIRQRLMLDRVVRLQRWWRAVRQRNPR